MDKVRRTVVVGSIKLPKKMFRAFVELEGMYRNMVEQLAMCAVGNGIRSFTKLKALKYYEMRNLYPQLPSHYAYTACQDASTRAKSFIKLKKRGLARREYPEVERVSIWLDDHLWRPIGLTSMRVATHKGWIRVELEPHRHYWRYVNRGWKMASEARIKLDKRNRKLLIYLTFVRDVGTYEPAGNVPVDVNEDNVTVMINEVPCLFETGVKSIVLGYYYRRKRVQRKYDKLYGTGSRAERKMLRKLKERHKKDDIRWKIANIIVGTAYEGRCCVVLERFGRKAANNMISRIGDDQLRHRIFQASFKGIQRAIEEKAKEYGVPIVYVNPRNSSKLCPIHNAEIIYDDHRTGRCSRGGELWHRDVVACYNLLLRAHLGDGSDAPSLDGHGLDGSPVPLGSTAAHEPIGIPRALWARWNSLGVITNEHEISKIST